MHGVWNLSLHGDIFVITLISNCDLHVGWVIAVNYLVCRCLRWKASCQNGMTRRDDATAQKCLLIVFFSECGLRALLSVNTRFSPPSSHLPYLVLLPSLPLTSCLSPIPAPPPDILRNIFSLIIVSRSTIGSLIVFPPVWNVLFDQH